MTTRFFEDAEKRRKELIELFEALPDRIICGVVGANGPGGGKVGGEVLWNLNLSLVAWRIQDDTVRKEPLIVTKVLTGDELDSIQNRISSESVISFIGKLCECSPFGDARAEFGILLDSPNDAELNEILYEYKKPTEIFDHDFGNLILNKSVDWFEGEILWLGKKVNISLSVDEENDVKSTIEAARSLIRRMDHWASLVNEYAIAQLLELKNENWLNDDEDPVGKKEFLDRMNLQSITVYPDGSFDFWHSDGDLFYGHSIQISGSIEDGLTHADIPG